MGSSNPTWGFRTLVRWEARRPLWGRLQVGLPLVAGRRNIECLLITGQDADYQLKVVVRDMDAFQVLLLERIPRIEGVSRVHSSFVLRRVVDKTELPLG